MAATSRLVVQMSPKEKKQLDARARRSGISTAEYVRRRVSDEDLDHHREEIEMLLDTLASVAPSVLQSLDRAIETATATTALLDKAGGASLS